MPVPRKIASPPPALNPSTACAQSPVAMPCRLNSGAVATSPNITSGDSPEAFLVDYFRGQGQTSVRPATPEARIPMIPLVLGLSTIGPMLLAAILIQDTFLAGFIVLALGILTIIGTLVSDLVLAWADPRIRYVD